MNFLTFGGPTINYHHRVKVLCKEAKNLLFFDKIIGLTEKDLQMDLFFWDQHGTFIEKNTRGYGYWIWKPYIIKKYLKTLKDDELLIYMDAGCSINPLGRKRLEEYVTLLKNHTTYGILSFQMNHLEEKKYTKKTLFDYLKTDKKDIESGQCMATVIIIKKMRQSEKIIDEWYKLSCNTMLINDEIDEEDEDIHFIEHRHDQSIYSLLVKKYGSIKIPDETYFAPEWNIKGIFYPFWSTRIRGC